MSEKVTVEARAPLVETEQGRISGRVDQMQLRDLPLNGRNLYNLIALQWAKAIPLTASRSTTAV